ncbi:MAG: C1 family peptidase [Vicingaceae bacterium]|nr:C1 family peptidase [Vicingaceae bacterium]
MKKSLFIALIFGATTLLAQEQDSTKADTLSFKKIVQWDANPVESQGQTGTCWSFSTSSFLESEIIRTKKGTHNLSEIFVARQVYVRKAENFVGRHGKAQFGEGSLGHDLMNAIDKYGIVPTEVFDGLQLNSEKHNHAELANILEAFLKAIIQNKGKKLTPVWMDAYNALLDVYLGKFPEEFEYQGEKYTPKSFAESLGINKENYVTLTSYTHRPYYSSFVLDIPDNWDNGFFYNVNLDELVATTKKALNDGYTIEWDADVSNKGFNSKKGIAVQPLKDEKPNFETVEEEMDVTPEIRQENYANYTVTDDHLMHIVGLAKGVDGKEYFIVKNSWGDERGQDDFKGHVLVSEAYFKMNTISVMLHKDAIENSLKKKLNF